MTVALAVEGLSVEYRRQRVVRESLTAVDIEVEFGEIVGVVGQSGAGKSILARAIVGLVPEPGRISAGNVRVLGHDLLAATPEEARRVRGSSIGVVVQNARRHLNPLVPIGKQIGNVMRAHGDADRNTVKEAVLDMLRQVGMPAPEKSYAAYPHELSGGMAQRAMIAMALICQPRVVVADEPTSGLDVTIQDQILRLLRANVTKDTADTGGTGAGLLISRDMGIIANFCDRVAVMHEGRIVESARVPEFFEEARHPVSRALIAAASFDATPCVPVETVGKVD
jgi:ABC-type dipeptide/oligopeptide/nickel transport system ATPase component